MDLISVIVPVYNVKNYLKKCVDSIIAQSYSLLQVILVDDGSTDGSGELCDSLAKADTRIQVIHKLNGGLSDARNVGIEFAEGQYYSFIDSDDYIEPDMIESLYWLAKNRNCQITISNMKRFFSDGSIETFYEPVNQVSIYEADKRFETLKQPSVCNKLFSAELFTDIRFPEGKYYEDTFVYHELLYKAERVGLTGKVGYWYLSRKESITGRERYTIRYFDFLEAVSRRMHFFIENDVMKYGIEACLSYYLAFSNAEKYLKNNDECKAKLFRAREEYRYAYKTIICSTDVTWKQKVKAILLLYCPKIHSKIF